MPAALTRGARPPGPSATPQQQGNRKLLSNRGGYANAIALLGNGSYGLTLDGKNWLFSQYSRPYDGSLNPGAAANTPNAGFSPVRGPRAQRSGPHTHALGRPQSARLRRVHGANVLALLAYARPAPRRAPCVMVVVVHILRAHRGQLAPSRRGAAHSACASSNAARGAGHLVRRFTRARFLAVGAMNPVSDAYAKPR